MESVIAFSASVALLVTAVAVLLRIVIVLGRRAHGQLGRRIAQLVAALLVAVCAYLLAAEGVRLGIGMLLGTLWTMAATHLVIGRVRAQRHFVPPVAKRETTEEARPAPTAPPDAFPAGLRWFFDLLAGAVFALAFMLPALLAFPGRSALASWIDAALSVRYAVDIASIIGFAYLAAPLLLILGTVVLALLSLGVKHEDRPMPQL